MALPGETTAAAAALLARADDMAAADVVQACRQFVREYGTLPTPLAALRKDRLRQIRDEAAGDGRMVKWIARRLGFSPNRFSKLTSAKTAEATT